MAPRCPVCGKGKPARIVYGYPNGSVEFGRDLSEGRITLGGCCVTEDDDKWECNACGYTWGSKSERARREQSRAELEARRTRAS